MTLDVRPAAPDGAMPDAAGLNFFDADPNLAFALAMRLPAADLDCALPILREAGEVAGGELDRLARIAERNPPRLVQYDARGERVDEVEYHPAYSEMERIAFGRFGLGAMSNRPGVLGWPGTVPHVFKYALPYR
jgi:hypothetical protein